ncbi:MAG TPA: 16S rRNA (cytidine(1402)-2'-O)-methyltransferase [Candidatus Nanoarchaeia archaeon]|nr:16S rRNA (cytidine(1402)-2'-O)-methyltransferase [Candidatus Nanoarchaeia archaeon]
MLYIVGTPIGNLEDISMRAIRILGEVDFILCEDTRTSRVLLDHYNIKTPCISYHQHSDDIKVDQIIKLLEQGKNLALITDAGTPGISDPGGVLVEKVLEHFGEDMKIESVPGPSAVTAALSISGIPTDKFIFMGFPPHKKGRQTFIRRILESEYPVVVYESKHRIVKFLNELKAAKESASISDEEDLKNKKKNLESVVVAREISKMHETVYRGDIDNIIAQITATPDDQRGEFVVIVG